ncbi:[formate-C-acetyltransferase]-activating enzyme [Zophobihabitans entericus]|uniref:[formate-C-acetyltransferase]-activating enzyme n=1 Tax=Zophobihabitans entericus TaxID=1635327 RepID=A0A6G9I8B4_9GAMM|nr:[formate-C-acetyltransferase]-activating enzyme [Zophobihabitans entericus]QIQ20451.1 [formate-C-acetyltransferase]-activating enzyme [Zophobihabitans entericus]
MTSSAVQRTNYNTIYLDQSDALAADQARIFNIQRYSLNDGFGIRTVIFFKGCPHYCPWCANPESISRKIQVVKRKSKCLHCATCLNDADECPSGAMERIGYDISLENLIKEILKDDIFFRSSGGGVTLSGGEVLLQAKFASQLLERLKKLGINTAIETAGDIRFEDFLSVAKYCDEVLFDFKIMDEEQAKQVSNIHLSRVLDNFARLYEQNIPLTPRIPLIPGYTLDQQNIERVIAFLKQFPNIKEIHLLPFHQFGEPKYDLIKRPYTMGEIKAPEDEEVQRIKAYVEQQGYTVMVGG